VKARSNMGPKKSAKSSSPASKPARKKKDPNAPKKNKSAYMFYSIKRHQELVKSDPSLKSKVAEIAKMVGAEWGKLSDSQKAPYAKQAEGDKKRYEKEMESFRQSQEEEEE